MPKTVRLHIYNDQESIGICAASIYEYAHLIGFRKREAHKITSLISDVLSQMLLKTNVQEQEDEMEVCLEQTPQGIKIIIHNHGIPLDTEKILTEAKLHISQGLAATVALAQKYADLFSIKTKGFQGNEIILEKYLISKKHLVPKLDITEESLGPVQIKNDIQVRLLQEDEAYAVTRLAYIAYHYSYPYELMYIPEKVKKEVVEKRLISAVSVMDETIISHSALVLADKWAKTAEIGIAFTDPNYRGFGCMNKLWVYLLDDLAVKMKLFGVFAMTVTSHPYSQKAAHKLGMSDCALLLSRTPVLEFESIDTNKPQRESIMIAFKVLNAPEKAIFYPPKHHKKMIMEIANQFGINISIGKHPFFHHDSAHNYSKIDIKKDSVFNIANITIHHCGKDLKNVFPEKFESLKISRIESIYLFLDLADYHTEKLTSYFEKLGFFFAGIMHKDNRMNLVLQFLNNQQFQFDSLKMASEIGEKISAYVKNEKEKSQGM
ncbi:MAG: hypothetical protein B7C24_17040 [Bacteroidetes bacterium 4572_77]|nr:MAG: hypothetical protein B7C24_17040 [Bacteroidetes bacterium 4572_77]